MQVEEYQAFKSWIAGQNFGDSFPEALGLCVGWDEHKHKNVFSFDVDTAIGYLFALNQYIYPDVFAAIKQKNYKEIYYARHHYKYKRKVKEANDFLIPLYFRYLNCSFDEYLEYEAITSLQKNAREGVIYIHRGNIACLKYKHPIEDVQAHILIDSNIPIKVHASFCTCCRIAFIRKEEYLRLRRKYPFLVADFCELASDGYSLMSDSSSMRSHSPLMLCGYNVNNDSALTQEQRQALLANIIYNGIMSKTEIIQYLEYFIAFNGSKLDMFIAVEKWESDLRFVRQLEIETHRIVSVTQIKAYSPKDIDK